MHPPVRDACSRTSRWTTPAARLDLDDDTLTENTRACYPLTHLNQVVRDGCAGHPKNVILLTCDAFGVLPPIARLTAEQAMYHFLSGYTAKVAGTERGVTEPADHLSAPASARPSWRCRRRCTPTSSASACASTTRSAGWSTPAGSAAATASGKRIDIGSTRAIIRAALSGAARQRPHSTGSLLRLRGSHRLPRSGCQAPRSAQHLDRPGRLRRDRQEARRGVPREHQAVRGHRAGGNSRRGPARRMSRREIARPGRPLTAGSSMFLRDFVPLGFTSRPLQLLNRPRDLRSLRVNAARVKWRIASAPRTPPPAPPTASPPPGSAAGSTRLLQPRDLGAQQPEILVVLDPVSQHLPANGRHRTFDEGMPLSHHVRAGG